MSDIERFNDPIANQIDWDWIVSGGSSFQTHELAHESNGNIRFKATGGSISFALGFIVIPVLFSPFIFLDEMALIPLGIFGIAGSWLLYHSLTPIVFDFEKGYFYSGRLRGNDAPWTKGLDWCKLNDIHALQIISEYISGDRERRGFNSFELNIVTKDAYRINVVDHGNIYALRSHAKALGDKLGVPVWDITLEQNEQ